MILEFILLKENNFVSVGKFRYVFFFFLIQTLTLSVFPETNFSTPNCETGESSLKQGAPPPPCRNGGLGNPRPKGLIKSLKFLMSALKKIWIDRN